MKILIENNQDKIEISEGINDIIKRAVELVLASENFKTYSEIGIMLVDNEQIREINSEHRNIDKPTDVLSFPLADIFEGKLQSDTGDYDLEENVLLLGDIIISLEMVEKQAQEYMHSFERELAFLVTHGAFHLLGYDHCDEEQERVMFSKQEAVLVEMGLKREKT